MALMNFTKIAIKNLFSRPATKDYPLKKREYPERSRGHIEIDIDNCIMCSMCQRKCPSGAITVDRNTKTWSIERMGCVQCGLCANSCPKSCLKIVPEYTEPAREKVVDSYSQPIPETPAGNVSVDISSCVLCGLCARICPQECIAVDRKETKTWTINRDKCVQCGACVDKCPKKCLTLEPENRKTGKETVTKE